MRKKWGEFLRYRKVKFTTSKHWQHLTVKFIISNNTCSNAKIELVTKIFANFWLEIKKTTLMRLQTKVIPQSSTKFKRTILLG